jgi:hypothetical protein
VLVRLTASFTISRLVDEIESSTARISELADLVVCKPAGKLLFTRFALKYPTLFVARLL